MEDKLISYDRNVEVKNIPRVRLEALVVAQNLTSRRRWHGRNKKRVPETSLRHLLLQRRPVPQVRGRNTPEIILQLTLRCRATFVRRVRAIDSSNVAARLNRSVVDRLRNLLIEVPRLRRVERHAEGHEGVGETLHTNADRTVAHVGPAGLGDGVEVDIDDAVQVEGDDLCDIVQLLEVVDTVLDEGRERDRSEIADGSLLRRRVLDNLSTEVRRFDCAEVLWLDLAVAG